MKRNRIYTLLLTCCFLLVGSAFGQSDWSLVKDNNWIKVFESDMNQSNFKRIKVECTLDGTFDKLLQILNNVENHKTWIYNTKHSYIIKRISANEYYYYTETFLPWPLKNRDAVVHIRFSKDSFNHSLRIVAEGVPDYLPVIDGKVRVPRSANSWLVTSPAPNKLHIVYTFEADPGGSLPAWLVNALVDKGPYESFRKLAEQLKQ
jgi:hypothetical protein